MVYAFLRRFKRSKKIFGVLVSLFCCFSLLMIINIPFTKELQVKQAYQNAISNIDLVNETVTIRSALSDAFLQKHKTDDIHVPEVPEKLPDEMVKWISRKQSLCDSKFTGFNNLFAEISNVTLDPTKNANHRGGEDINAVQNQPESVEYLTLKKDYLTLYCKGENYQKYAFNRKSANFEWFNSLSFKRMDMSPQRHEPSSFINTTVVAVQRYEYVNMYHTMTDWYNTFLMMIFFRLKPKKFIVLWMDAHPKGSLDSVWETLFAPVIQASRLQQRTRFRKLIWSINGYESFLSQHSRYSVPYIEEFRNFVLHQFNVNKNTHKNCKNLNIVFIFRHDYVAHPRNMGGTVQRKIANEEELIQSCKQQFKGHNISGIQLDSLPFGQQLEIVSSTDILIGMHGAGMTLALFLPKHAALIELYPSYFSTSNTHFKSIAKWRGLIYFQWQNSLQSNERGNYKTFIHPTVVESVILKSKNKLCGTI